MLRKIIRFCPHSCTNHSSNYDLFNFGFWSRFKELHSGPSTRSLTLHAEPATHGPSILHASASHPRENFRLLIFAVPIEYLISWAFARRNCVQIGRQPFSNHLWVIECSHVCVRVCKWAFMCVCALERQRLRLYVHMCVCLSSSANYGGESLCDCRTQNQPPLGKATRPLDTGRFDKGNK